MFLQQKRQHHQFTTIADASAAAIFCLINLPFWRLFQVNPGLTKTAKAEPLLIAGAEFSL